MIFGRTIDLVLTGRKRCTTRLRYAGDIKHEMQGGRVCVMTRSARTRWYVGNTYAVQRERCHAAEGRIVIEHIEAVEDPLNVSLEVAWADGFESVEAYQKVWRELHRCKPVQPCWRLWFRLVAKKKAVTA